MSADSQACRKLFFFSDASYVCELIARALKRKICGTIAFTDTFPHCLDARRRVYMNYHIFFKFAISFRRALDTRLSLISETFAKSPERLREMT